MATAYADTTDEATKIAVRDMIDWLESEKGLTCQGQDLDSNSKSHLLYFNQVTHSDVIDVSIVEITFSPLNSFNSLNCIIFALMNHNQTKASRPFQSAVQY